ncbi:unnamed protein product [Rhodiola kirilowii]
MEKSQKRRKRTTNCSPGSSAKPAAVDVGGEIYPSHANPTPEKCWSVRDDLLALHGFPLQFVKYRNLRRDLPSLGSEALRVVESLEGIETPVEEERESVLDGLVSIMLSQNTTDANARKAFMSLKSAFPDWEDVLGAESKFIENAIRCGGLAATKASAIKNLLSLLLEQRWKLCLEHLRGLSVDEVKAELSQFKEIGPKTPDIVLVDSMCSTFSWMTFQWTHIYISDIKGHGLGCEKDVSSSKQADGDLNCLLFTHGKLCNKCSGKGAHSKKAVADTTSCPLFKYIKDYDKKLLGAGSSNLGRFLAADEVMVVRVASGLLCFFLGGGLSGGRRGGWFGRGRGSGLSAVAASSPRLVSDWCRRGWSAVLWRRDGGVGLLGRLLRWGWRLVARWFRVLASVQFGADANEAGNLKSILHQYEIISGQMINLDKSEVCFSKNTPADKRVDFCNVLRIPQVTSHSRYLGLPLIMGQRKTEAFRGILDKMWRKVNDWRCKLLSAGGREVLIKAVLQAMPVYMMSVYYVPRKIIGEMYKLISQYWWDKEEEKGISWVSKGILQKNKCDGGLGFKDMYAFNDVMLMKVGWRMMKFPGLLMSQILTAKYCKGRSIFEARLGSNPSSVWREVMKSVKTLLDGVWWDDRGATFMWKHTSSGSFTVRSAYDVIKRNADLLKPDLGEQSDKSSVCWFWKRLWAARVPNKMIALKYMHFRQPLCLLFRSFYYDFTCYLMLCGSF